MRPGQAPLSHATGLAAFAEPLPASFYDRPTASVARDLLGRWIAVRTGRTVRAGRIVETEAYVANDPSNHADRGRTLRNAAMFGRPGTLYVYRIHQVHCANAVTRPGQAVLLRAAEPLTLELPTLTGPGRLCRSLGIGPPDNGTSLVNGRVRILAGDSRPKRVLRTPRVGISQAVERPLRFVWAGHPAVSPPRPWAHRRA